MSELVERVAKAIEEETGKFENPVYLYIEGEARKRWLKENPTADFDGWYDLPQSRDPLVDYKLIARAAIAAVREQLAKENPDFLSCQECGAHVEIDSALT